MHIKFDEDGNPMTAEESKVLPKVKQFLKDVVKENINEGLNITSSECSEIK